MNAPCVQGENNMSYGSLKSRLFRTVSGVSLAGLVLAGVAAALFTAAAPPPAYADNLTPPAVPANLQVPDGHKVYRVGHAVGTQNYVCLPTDTGVGFVLFTPQANLFGEDGKQLMTHFFSPNPLEANANPKVLGANMVRAAWQDSKDSSTVWGKVLPGHASTDPAFVEPGAIAWLLVTAAGTQNGPTGGDRLSATTYVQRVNTHGGLAPTTGCASPADVGNQAFVPYTTDYYFYKATGSQH
jgi:hypothetical protein